MLSKNDLQEMSVISTQRKSGTLPDISEVQIEGDTPEQRLTNYLSQVVNPYYFRVGNTPVHIIYDNNGKPLEEVIKKFFILIKTHDNLTETW